MKPFLAFAITCLALSVAAAEPEPSPTITIGQGDGWVPLTGDDFVNVNCKTNTWTWKDGHASCTGDPVGVIRYKNPLTNFELSLEWMHKKHGGNSGIFIWATPESLVKLIGTKRGLPQGIEVQVLDLGYKERYEKRGKKAD